MKNINKLTILFFFSLFLISIVTFAQQDGSGFPLPGEEGDSTNQIDVPIFGNVILYLFLSIGSLLGIKKIKNRK